MNELIRRNNEGSFLGIVRSQKKKKQYQKKASIIITLDLKTSLRKKASLIITIFSNISLEFSSLTFLANRNSIAANRFLIAPKYVFCLFSACILGNLQFPVVRGWARIFTFAFLRVHNVNAHGTETALFTGGRKIKTLKVVLQNLFFSSLEEIHLQFSRIPQ